MHKLKIVIVTSLALSAFAIPVFGKASQRHSSSVAMQVKSVPICKDPNGKTRERTNPAETRRNAQGCVVSTYPSQCATANCYNCEDFQYQEDAQAFFNAFSNDPSGLDGRPGLATAGKPNVACENLPKRPR